MSEEALKAEQANEQEEEQKKKTNKLIQWIKDHPKAFFWIRLVTWTLCACVLPFIFISWRFELFKSVSKLQVGGWGIIAIAIVGIFVLAVLKYVKLALSAKYSFTAQIINGVCKVIIPLLLLFAIIWCVRDSTTAMLKVLGIVIFLEFIAIPINPLPKWAYEKQKDAKDGERKETMDYLVDKFFNRKKKEESGE